jgi:hypothetical protein
LNIYSLILVMQQEFGIQISVDDRNLPLVAC